jgi:hypothetical protein
MWLAHEALFYAVSPHDTRWRTIKGFAQCEVERSDDDLSVWALRNAAGCDTHMDGQLKEVWELGK